MTRRRIAYVMEQTLGNVTHYLNLRRAEAELGEQGVSWLPIEYRNSRLPWTLTGGWSARHALSRVKRRVDGVFIHTTTLALLCLDQCRGLPTIMSTDGTPANKRSMREAYGLKPHGRYVERTKRRLQRGLYGRASALVGWSSWVKASFVEDYGYPEQDVAVIPPGVDVAAFAAGDRNHELPRILFVGGDFERKGGAQLLDVYRQRLRDKAELILVTRGNVAEEPGVRVHRDIQANSPELRQLYATSDLFVLPTLADCFSLVAIEALAASMPVVSTRVGGIPDIVVEGETGHLLDPGDSRALGDVVEALVTDPARRRAMGERGRKDAVERFNAQHNAQRLFDFVRSRC
jgi:glycosyltransferase involved in cell wall biosynthesis